MITTRLSVSGHNGNGSDEELGDRTYQSNPSTEEIRHFIYQSSRNAKDKAAGAKKAAASKAEHGRSANQYETNNSNSTLYMAIPNECESDVNLGQKFYLRKTNIIQTKQPILSEEGNVAAQLKGLPKACTHEGYTTASYNDNDSDEELGDRIYESSLTAKYRAAGAKKAAASRNRNETYNSNGTLCVTIPNECESDANLEKSVNARTTNNIVEKRLIYSKVEVDNGDASLKGSPKICNHKRRTAFSNNDNDSDEEVLGDRIYESSLTAKYRAAGAKKVAAPRNWNKTYNSNVTLCVKIPNECESAADLGPNVNAHTISNILEKRVISSKVEVDNGAASFKGSPKTCTHSGRTAFSYNDNDSDEEVLGDRIDESSCIAEELGDLIYGSSRTVAKDRVAVATNAEHNRSANQNQSSNPNGTRYVTTRKKCESASNVGQPVIARKTNTIDKMQALCSEEGNRAAPLVKLPKKCTHLGRADISKKGVLPRKKRKVNPPTCKHVGCTNKARKGGVCVRHGAKSPTCTHEGCTKNAVRNKVCWTHGAKQTAKPCGHKGCANLAQKGGLCNKHGAKWPPCIREGCTNYAQQRGVCVRHGAKRVRPKCNHEGCTNQSVKNGVCWKHGAKDIAKSLAAMKVVPASTK